MISTAHRPVHASVKSSPFPTTIAVFFSVGLLETVLAYFLFSRADDHGYFLELANAGVSVVPDYRQDFLDLKAKAAGLVFYIVASPSRWLGGHELVHLLWLRAVTLSGFLAAFGVFQRVAAPNAPSEVRDRARSTFMILALLYPGQLAWTASLLRDGAGTALFFFGLACLRKDLRLILAPLLLLACFALRPEYALILGSLLAAIVAHRILKRVRSRILLLMLVLLTYSIATHSVQKDSGEFVQLAFGDSSLGYPVVSSALDIAAYFRILLQALLDPLELNALAWNSFGIADCAFFVYVLWQSRHLLRHASTLVAALTMALMFCLWTFAYFEIFVSGFSRHRLCLEVALIAMIALYQAHASPPRGVPKS